MKESLRTLRTNIQFCGDDVKVIMFTSSVPNEGKSTVTVNLARSLSESGKSVLVIDTDMRKSVLMGRLKAKANEDKQVSGLSHYLSGQKGLPEIVYLTQMPKFCMVFAGPTVPNPTEILDKKYFEDLIAFGRKNFDYVLIDCAPIGAAIDAAVVAKHCDGAVLVMAQGSSDRRMVLDAKKQLEVAGIKILGAVLNKVRAEKGYYGRYYGSHYGKYYGKYYGNQYGEQ
ncbi:CpsD/CapB family tyrosine-protein kinase [Eubacterium sp. MSJ-21]|nr:CpsD/CapB family tyrosine-protein kinase [Eubacterium sp. MSJ-21]